MPHRLKNLGIDVNGISNWLVEWSHSMSSKALAVVGGTSAVTHTQVGESLGVMQWLAEFPLLNFLSGVAVVLLIIERSFILWAHWRRHKRGEI